MPTVVETAAFTDWLTSLKDVRGRIKIAARLARLSRGNPGDVAPIGEGLSELRVDFGPGYRVYYGARGAELVIVLAGGDKRTQRRDIEAAKEAWRVWKEESDGQD